MAAGLAYELDRRSYSTLGPVIAWVGDRLWTGKPPRRRTRHPAPRRRTRHPGLLNLSLLSAAGWNEYPVKAEGVNRDIA